MRDRTMSNIRNIISKTSLFGMLDEQQIGQIAAHTDALRVGQNMCVVNQGDAPQGTFWLVFGQVKIVLYTSHGVEKTVEILGDGTCFGLSEMLLGRPHLASVKATVDSMLLHTDRDVMMQVAKENFGFAREMMICLGRQFYGLVRDIESYSLSSKQRLATYLLRQSEREISDEIELVANKALIASRLSLTPETLSRALHELAEEEIIAVDKRRIKIIDRQKLSSVLA
jgi:CRP-like cAMP-binding protein